MTATTRDLHLRRRKKGERLRKADREETLSTAATSIERVKIKEQHCLKNSSLDSINSSKRTVCSNSFSYLSICVCWLTTTLARRRRKRSLRIATKLSTPSTTTAVKETFHHHHLSYVMVKEIDIDGWGDSERAGEQDLTNIGIIGIYISKQQQSVRLLLLSVAIIYNLRCCCHCCHWSRLDRLGFALLRLNRLKKGLFTYAYLLLCCWRWLC